jgi:intein/homing endonuclease
LKFKFETSEIICSDVHKFYANGAWKEAKDMEIGDVVSGQKLLLIEDYPDGDVVKITVADAHTYICEGLLSHNKGDDN